jgi:hypothetical protein
MDYKFANIFDSCEFDYKGEVVKPVTVNRPDPVNTDAVVYKLRFVTAKGQDIGKEVKVVLSDSEMHLLGGPPLKRIQLAVQGWLGAPDPPADAIRIL